MRQVSNHLLTRFTGTLASLGLGGNTFPGTVMKLY